MHEPLYWRMKYRRPVWWGCTESWWHPGGRPCSSNPCGTQKPGIILQTWDLSYRNTALWVGTSHLVLCPGSPDRSQLLENTLVYLFFFFLFWADQPRQWLSTPPPPFPREKVPLPAGPRGPAVSDVPGSCAEADGGWWGEEGLAETHIHVAPWVYRFLLVQLFKQYISFYFEMCVFSWLK